MLIAVLGLGVFFGMVSGAGAMIAGHSFMTALILYISIGMLTTLIAAIAVVALSSDKGRKIPSHGYVQ